MKLKELDEQAKKTAKPVKVEKSAARQKKAEPKKKDVQAPKEKKEETK
jgi:hypothetical protein